MADNKETLEHKLKGEYQSAWDALVSIRQTWDDKEKALIAQANDSVGGNITRVKITDAALSTLAYERQARVSAQLPTGKVYGTSKKEEGKARLANIALQHYIIPNANSQFDMLIKQRMWGVYASVYGSMPMLYDYRVDDQYIGPDCWLVDPRSFLPQPGFNSISDMDWCMISTVQPVSYLQSILKKKNTSWNKTAVAKVIKQAKEGKPSRDDDAEKESWIGRDRYAKDQAKGRIELVTKYESGDNGRWITFAPDYNNAVLRDIPNPHKSGKIPVVMRHCFPLMNSIFGLGDFDRGMKIQKAKDSLIALFLEGVKNRVYPPLKIDTSKVTPSTIRYQAGAKWRMTDMNAVQPMQFGGQPTQEFQASYSALQSMLMNQFGTTDTQVTQGDSGNPAFGKTPEALKQLSQRENARDTWDRFMQEKADEELYEGMINLLTVKMEKPIDFTVFEEEIRQIADEHEDVMDMFPSGKAAQLTLSKKDLKSSRGFRYIIDMNTTMKQDDEAQLASLTQLFGLLAGNPEIQQQLMQYGYTYDLAEHIKKIFISSGIQDWERILKEGQAENTNMPMVDQTAQPLAPQQDPMMQEQMMAQQLAQQQQMQPQPAPGPQFDDPDIAMVAEQMLNGGM